MMCDAKSAIVTGAAGKGMGRSVALTLAREGANVVVNYRKSTDSAAAIAKHIESRGGRALAFQADITEPDQCQALVDAATETFNRVDICIIGPGGGWHPEPIDKLDSAAALDDVRRELAPVYHLMPLVLPGMYVAPGSIRCGTNACEPWPSSTTMSVTSAVRSPRTTAAISPIRYSFAFSPSGWPGSRVWANLYTPLAPSKSVTM